MTPGAIDYPYLLDLAAKHALELEGAIVTLRKRVVELEAEVARRSYVREYTREPFTIEE